MCTNSRYHPIVHLVSICGLVFVLSLVGARAEPKTKTKTVFHDGNVKVGQPMPTFAGWTLKGEIWSLSRILKKDKTKNREPLVISFFATWCEPCRKGMPALRDALRDTGANSVLIAYGQSEEKVVPFLEEFGLKSTVLCDEFLKISSRVGVTKSLPRTYVINPDGKVTAIFVQEGNDFRAALKRAIEAARK
jgi:peroxiredoxin